MKQKMITLLLYTCIIYVVSAFLFFFLSDSILFQPPRFNPIQNMPATLSLPLPNGNQLSAIYLPNPQAKYTLLVSHGNATDLNYSLSFLNNLRDHGFSVFAYDYQGYGASTGKPSEKNTYVDITTAYEYLTKNLHIPAQHIIALGHSLGAGPSIYLARNFKIGGLIIESPFVSAYRVKTILPLFPFDKYPNLQVISKIQVPVLLIHGTEDSIIPVWHGEKIFAAIQSPKQAYWVKGADHNGLLEYDPHHYWEAIDNFISSLN